MRVVSFLKTCAQHPYFIVSAFFIVSIFSVNYDYYLLGKKIIPVKIPLKFTPPEKTTVVSDNFASDTYTFKLLLLRNTCHEYSVKHFCKDFSGSSVQIKIFEDRENLIYNQTVNFSDFSHEFFHRNISHEDVALSSHPNEHATGKIRFSKNKEYKIEVNPTMENKLLNKQFPRLILFGVDDGYYGAGYFLYSALFGILWGISFLLLFAVRLLLSILKRVKKNNDVASLNSKSIRVAKIVSSALMTIWTTVVIVMFHNPATNEMGRFWSIIIMIILMASGNLIIFAMYFIYHLFGCRRCSSTTPPTC